MSWCPVPSVRKAAAAAAPRPALSEELKAGSEREHDGSNRLVLGRAALAFSNPAVWAELLAQFQVVHRELERALDVASSADARVARLHAAYFRRLARSDAFLTDVSFHGGGAAPAPPVPATLAYTSHLAQLAKEAPLLVLSHAQTQYLAMLAGGQQLARMVTSAMALPRDGRGVAAFDFAAAVAPAERSAFKAALKRDFDALGEALTDEQRAGLMREKRDVFARNNAIISTVLNKAQGSLVVAWLRLFAAHFTPLVRRWRTILFFLVLAALLVRVYAQY